ncbi:hypothetical protein [Curtobacterium luteum]|uniref:Lipoprotein n=1 Tax=Curtobacterium luteum TaxID=33881 RepID=A0A175S356_9MICO|nr:hypothetical protein [Curtobacterium luteum]KTR10751.1 hypothetical protein NS184_01465 [Curtobacterium luteum]
MRRLRAPLVVVLCAAVLTGCSTAEGIARQAFHGGGSAPCPVPGADSAPGAGSVPGAGSAPDTDRPGPTASASAGPAPEATLDPTIAREVAAALRAVRALPGVDRATETTTNAPSSAPDPACPSREVTTNHFSSRFTVVTAPSASPAEVGAVPSTMAEELAWTGVSLTLTVPAGSGHIASTTRYEGTFDQVIPRSTSTEVAQGLATLAATPHVAGLDATIPYTMRVDYGSLTIGVDSVDQAVLDEVHSVIERTAFKDTTLHGSFGNGAKP